MTAEEAITVAHSVAQKESWTWRLPVKAVRKKRWFGRGVQWHVMSNHDHRGVNVKVVIDDRTGQILSQAFLPR